MRAFTHHILDIPIRKDFISVAREGDGMKKTWLLRKGERYGAFFPAGAAVDVDQDYKGTKLDDFVFNALSWLVVTERVKSIFEKEPITSEVFPLGIRNRKGKPVERPYFLVNVLGTVDCLDLNRSEYERSAFKPEEVHTFERIVLDPARIPPDQTLFRLKECPSVKIIRSDLVARLREAGVTGFDLLELDAPVMI